jgi:hypothetical protein
MNNELHKNIEISDFQLASFLVYQQTELLGIRRETPTKAVFIFPDNKKTQELVERFSNLSSQVEPLAFSSAQKRLKQLLYLSLKQ